MVEIANETCRGRGRPQIRSDEATLELIVQAANEEFLAKSYAETSMSAVAQRAGVSTKTLYRLAPSKADLFKSVVSQRIETFMLALDQQSAGAPDLQSALEQILIAFGQLTLSKETTAIFRLVLGECERFPEIGHAFYEGAIKRAGGALARWLGEQCRKGLLDLDDPDRAGGMLRGMMIMEPQRAAMLGQREAPAATEIEERARMCAALFLNGCIRTRRRDPA